MDHKDIQAWASVALAQEQRADRAEAAIERVRELHEPLECPCGTCDVVICAECLSEAHPCPTIRALDGGECGE